MSTNSKTKKNPLSTILFALALMIVIAIFGSMLVGCSSATPVDTNVTGDWVYSEDGVTFTGTVSDEGNLTLYLDLDGSQALYWKGTFPTEMEDGASTVSDGDVEALSGSLFGSLDATKEFAYTDGHLTFEFGMMGVTKDVELHR